MRFYLGFIVAFKMTLFSVLFAVFLSLTFVSAEDDDKTIALVMVFSEFSFLSNYPFWVQLLV